MYVEVSINVPKENIIVFEYAINELRKMKKIYAMYHNNVNHPLHNDIKSFCWPVPLNVESWLFQTQLYKLWCLVGLKIQEIQ